MLIALKSGAPLIPVGIWGTQFVIPHGSTRPRPTLRPVRVHFGPPLRFDDLKEMPPRQARELARKRLEEAMLAAIEVARTS
jgi:1-acyl-sn-glycerol-3-phosphate acyltransferase